MLSFLYKIKFSKIARICIKITFSLIFWCRKYRLSYTIENILQDNFSCMLKRYDLWFFEQCYFKKHEETSSNCKILLKYMILKRNNGQKLVLNIRERTFNILRGVHPHPKHPLRHATIKIVFFVTIFYYISHSEKKMF